MCLSTWDPKAILHYIFFLQTFSCSTILSLFFGLFLSSLATLNISFTLYQIHYCMLVLLLHLQDRIAVHFLFLFWNQRRYCHYKKKKIIIKKGSKQIQKRLFFVGGVLANIMTVILRFYPVLELYVVW